MGDRERGETNTGITGGGLGLGLGLGLGWVESAWEAEEEAVKALPSGGRV